MSLEQMPADFALTLSPWMLWAAFLFVLALFGALSWVLHFHWREYGVGKAAVKKAEAIYFIGSFGILGAAFVSLILM